MSPPASSESSHQHSLPIQAGVVVGAPATNHDGNNNDNTGTGASPDHHETSNASSS